MFLYRMRTFWLLKDGLIVKIILAREDDGGLRVITRTGVRLSAFFGPAVSVEIGIEVKFLHMTRMRVKLLRDILPWQKLL